MFQKAGFPRIQEIQSNSSEANHERTEHFDEVLDGARQNPIKTEEYVKLFDEMEYRRAVG